MEQAAQTEDLFLASMWEEDSSEDDTGNQPDGDADGVADGDLEKQPPKDYDEETFLVQWAGPGDKVCNNTGLARKVLIHLAMEQKNPRNLSQARKWVVTVVLGIMTLGVTIGSSIWSTAAIQAAAQFHVSTEVMILGTSLFVLGFAFGPIVFGPISELYGRKTPLFVGMLAFSIFEIPVAVATNVETIFICRFLAGLFASAPLAIVCMPFCRVNLFFAPNEEQNGGLLADIFNPIDRGVAVAVFAAATFIGPVAGPVIGGFITESYLRWRWTQYITAIIGFFFTTVAFFIVPETHEPTLLRRRATKLRQKTKIWAIHAKSEENAVDPKKIAENYLLKPFQMLFLEPILFLVTLYMGFIYGFLYLSFTAYPAAFQRLRGWNEGVGALPFAAVIVGVAIGCAGVAIFSKTRFKNVMERDGHIVPEERLIPMMVGGVLLPAGMFWFGWTSNPHITWVPQVISGGFLGAGIILIFLQVKNNLGGNLVEQC